MHILIKKINGETYPLNVAGNCRVDEVKRNIHGQTGIPIPKQRLVWNGLELADGNQTLDAAGVLDQGTLNLLVSVKPSHMTIFVKTMQDKTLTIEDLNIESTVLDLKKRIDDYEGMPPDQQRMTFGARNMDDHQTMGDLGMQDGSTVHLNLRLRGGLGKQVQRK